MIVEMRTYSFRPGMAPAALERIALGVQERTKLSPLGGLWQSDIGRLHRIVHLWPYDSLAHREAVRGRFGELRNWPARTGEFTVESETKILKPAPFSPPLEPGRKGPVYEICTDVHLPQALDRIVAAWAPAIGRRTELAPLIGAWSTVLGPMYQWIHIWAYRSLEHRREVLARARQASIWPPSDDPSALFLSQETSLYTPAAFSPLQ